MRKLIGILAAFSILLCCSFPASSQTCSSPLNGGMLAATSSPVCPATYFAINVSGASTGTGLRYQWEASTDSVTWNPLLNYTTPGISLAQNATTWYRRKMFCNAGDSACSDVLKVPVKNYVDCYCNPGTATCTNSVSITNVMFGGINNSSTCGTGSYTDYSASVPAATVMQGTFVPITITSGSTISYYVHCYVDFNQNGSFEAKEKTLLLAATGNVYSGFIKVPFRAKTGNVRMRIIINNVYNSSVCYQSYPSEIEDYLVNISPNTSAATGFVLHVKQGVTGSINTGQSWDNALPDVRSALFMSDPGDTIKVAKGTYYNGTSQTNGLVLQDSIIVLGGYPDTGTPTDAQRNPAVYPTMLVGSVNSNSTTNNDYHVVFASGKMNQCVIDGFILQEGGNAYGNNASQARGGGISIENGADILVRNCVIRNNNYASDGTAIAVTNAKPVFQNCIVTGNTAYRNNILIQQASEVSFLNFLASKNTAEYLMQVDSSVVTFRSSTLANNLLTKAVATALNKSTVNFFNAITHKNMPVASWQNTNDDSTEVVQEASHVTFHNCLTQVQSTGVNLILGQSAKFRDTTSVAGADGLYFTSDDGYTLLNPCSPAINAGDNTEAVGITTDITGASRVFENRIDLGAYEVQQNLGVVPAVLYVNAAATGANDGSSWANAFTDLHKALQACSDTIKIAAGTYTPWKTATAQPYWFENKRMVLGAYPPTGSPANADRDYARFPTKIDGLMTTGESAEIVVRGQRLDSTSVVDGLTITNVGRYTYAYEYGAMIYTHCNNPVLRNVTFTGNHARVFLGRNNRRMQFLSCSVENNTSTEYARLDLVWMVNCGNPLLRNCQVTNNSLLNSTSIVGEYGKVMYLANTHAVMDSCLFLSNRSNVMTVVNGNPVVTNSRFLQNYAGNGTVDVINQSANPVFRQCIFRDTVYSVSRYGGIMNNYRSNPVFTDCQFYNGKTSGYGGVAYNDSSKASFTRCVFVNCQNNFYNINGSNMELTNCLSTGSDYVYYPNTASFMHNVRSHPVVNNVTVVNSRSAGYGVIYNDANSNPQISNSIFWKNFQNGTNDAIVLKGRMDVVNAAPKQLAINNSMFEFFDAGAAGKNTRGVDPRFKKIDNPIGLDSTWFSADDGLQLCDCSPAINSGNNLLVTETTDIALRPRTINQTVDGGAYELQYLPAKLPSTVYVNAAAAAGGEGGSWSGAYNNLQAAFTNSCADTIKIAAGVYKPAVAFRDSIFFLNRNAVIQGSYSTASGKQDVDATPTILSGDLGAVDDSTDNSFGLMKAIYFDTLKIDGVVFRDANNENAISSVNAGALRAEYIKNFSLANCRFYNNTAKVQGGGLCAMYVENTDLQKTVFSKNKATWGAGIYFFVNGSSRKIKQCVFDRNDATFQGGGVWINQSGTAVENCLFIKNSAQQGAGMYVEGNPGMSLTNCTFATNYAVGGSTGAGIYFSKKGWSTTIVNCIFTRNGYGYPPNQGPFQDIYHEGYMSSDIRVDLAIHHTACSSEPIYYFGGGNIDARNISYKNEANPIGPDNKWFTADDGLQLSVCSMGVDVGDNASVNVTEDLIGNSRIFGQKVDLGAYEFDGQPAFTGLLNNAKDSLVANREITDTLGWTHYFNGCRYLLSIKKNGQTIGTVGDGTFALKVFAGANYGSGAGRNLTAAAYNTTGQPWYVMNRYWNVKSTHAVQDSILVRFPYTNADFADVKGSNPAVNKHGDMDFFKVTGTDNPFDLSVTANNFFRYKNDSLPSLSTWKYLQQDSVHLCEYYVSSFSGGGGGALYTGPLPDVTFTAQNLSPASVGAGGVLAAAFTEANPGAGIAGGHKVQFYLSADNVLTPGANGDTLLGFTSIASLNAGANTGTLQKNLLIPCSAAPGSYYLFFAADGENTVVETNEDNNRMAVPFSVTAGFSIPATPIITASPRDSICSGTTVTLSAVAPGCSNCTYTWSSGSSGSTFSINYSAATPTPVTNTVTATNVCGSALASKTVVVLPTPGIAAWANTYAICQGDTVKLMATGTTSFTWSGSNLLTSTGSAASALPLTPGSLTYTVTGTTNGCSATATTTVTVFPKPVLSITPADTTVCAGGSLTLTVRGAATYFWSPASGLNTAVGATVTASPTTATTYTVLGISDYGCRSTLTRTVSPQNSVTPSVQIAYTGCPGNNLQFTATPANGGSAPTYQWYLNNVLKGTGATINLTGVANGAEVYVKMTSSSACASPQTVASSPQAVTCITTAVAPVDALESLLVSPVPSTGIVTIKLKLLQAKNLAMKIFDETGKVVYESPAATLSGTVTRQLDLRRQAQGLYYLQLTIGGQTMVEKLILAR